MTAWQLTDDLDSLKKPKTDLLEGKRLLVGDISARLLAVTDEIGKRPRLYRLYKTEKDDTIIVLCGKGRFFWRTIDKNILAKLKKNIERAKAA